ncbi:MAG: h [Pedosphaera sp.]|nr:h [Pedosphaera sp.]
MKAKPIMTLVLALALPACTLLAQNQNDGPADQGPPPSGENGGPPGGGPGRRHRLPPMPIILALDANHDGIISADEIANAVAALKTLDKNGDGQLTKDEYLPPHPPRGQGNGGGHQRPVPPIVAALDTNGDGIISADEIANAVAALTKLDKNGDGQLTMDEVMGPRPPHPDGNGPDDGQRPPPPNQNN